jgi:multiple sugar transport system permease protein
MISPAILFSLVINLVSIFGGAALLDQGTAFNFGISAYDNYVGYVMFNNFDYGYGASLAWVFLMMMFVVVMLLFRSTRYWVHYADADGEHAL